MDNVVPGALRHLREADIMSMAGLELAALGQEYYRIGAVHSTMRQEVQLTGIVEVPEQAFEKAVSPTFRCLVYLPARGCSPLPVAGSPAELRLPFLRLKFSGDAFFAKTS